MQTHSRQSHRQRRAVTERHAQADPVSTCPGQQLADNHLISSPGLKVHESRHLPRVRKHLREALTASFLTERVAERDLDPRILNPQVPGSNPEVYTGAA